MNAAKQKGTAFEAAIVDYLNEHGWTRAERRALNGAQDRGDIAGIAGLVIEAKNCKTLDLAGWLTELEVEIANDHATTGVVVAKRRGKNVSQAYAILSFGSYCELLKLAGYGQGSQL